MDSQIIMGLLLLRHKRDLVVAECPTSTVYAGGYGQIDLWAMRKSWAKPMVTGYEIKISRSDFLRDDKWRKYLDYCDVFFFAAPPGIIKPEELPPEAGLIEATKNGNMMRVKKKAPLRETKPKSMAKVYKAILMNRATIGEADRTELTKQERMNSWSVLLKNRRDLSLRVSGAIMKMVQDCKGERDKALRERRELDTFAKALRKFGIDLDQYPWQVRKQIDTKLRDRGLDTLKQALLALNTASRALGDILQEADND